MPLRTNDIISRCRHNLLIDNIQTSLPIATVECILKSFNGMMRNREISSKLIGLMCNDIYWVEELHRQHRHLVKGFYVNADILREVSDMAPVVKSLDLDALTSCQWLEMQEVYVLNARQFSILNKIRLRK